MAWTTPRTFVAGEVETASIFNTHLRDNLNALVPQTSTVATSQTTTSTSYTDLATTGPAVTLTTGTSALVWLGADMRNSGANLSSMSVAVSGATTVAAADTAAVYHTISTSAVKVSNFFKLSGLTAGPNVFTAKYRVAGGTGTFIDRWIMVVAPF